MQTLLISSIVFAPLAFGSAEPWSATILQSAFIAMAIILILRQTPIIITPVVRAMLLACGIVTAIGVMQLFKETPVNSPAFFPFFTTWRPATLQAAALWISFGCTLFAVPQIIRTEQDLRRVLWAIFALGVFISLMGILQRAEENSMIYGWRNAPYGHPFGPFANRDHAANYLLLSFFSGAGLLFSGFSVRRDFSSELVARRFLVLVLLSVIVIGILKTGSRGAAYSLATAAAAGGLFGLSFVKNRTKRFLSAITLCTALCAVTFFVFKTRPIRLDNPAKDRPTAARLSIYKSGLKMIGDFPLFGSGLGAMEHSFPMYQDKIGISGIVRHAHNDLLEIFIGTGFAGGLAWLSALLFLFIKSFRNWSACQSPEIKPLIGGLTAAALAFCLHGLVDFSFSIPANAFTFLVIAGLLGSTCAQQPIENRETVIPFSLSIPLAVFAAAAALITIPPAAGWCFWQLGKNADPPRQEYCYKKAMRFNPDPEYAFRLGALYYNRTINNQTDRTALLEKSLSITSPYVARLPFNSDLASLQQDIISGLDSTNSSPR